MVLSEQKLGWMFIGAGQGLWFLVASIRTQGFGMASWEVIWIIILVKISRAFSKILGVRGSLSSASNGALVLINADHRWFMLKRVMGWEFIRFKE